MPGSRGEGGEKDKNMVLKTGGSLIQDSFALYCTIMRSKRTQKDGCLRQVIPEYR